MNDRRDPTPERRWRWESSGGFSWTLHAPDGAAALTALIWTQESRLRILAALNEAEDLRERVRVLESLVIRVATMRKNDWIALSLEARALAGAETEAGR